MNVFKEFVAPMLVLALIGLTLMPARSLADEASPATNASQALKGVVLHNGKPVAGAIVRLVQSVRLQQGKTAKQAGQPRQQVVAQTTASADGTFTFSGIDPGNYMVIAAMQKQQSRGREIVNLKPGQTLNVQIDLQPAGKQNPSNNPAPLKKKKAV